MYGRSAQFYSSNVLNKLSNLAELQLILRILSDLKSAYSAREPPNTPESVNFMLIKLENSVETSERNDIGQGISEKSIFSWLNMSRTRIYQTTTITERGKSEPIPQRLSRYSVIPLFRVIIFEQMAFLFSLVYECPLVMDGQFSSYLHFYSEILSFQLFFQSY